MRPAENLFSRYSTVIGKKSKPSFAVRQGTAATSSIVSPYLITTEPSACLATLPVSTISSLLPSLIDSFKYFFVCISNRDGTAEHIVKLYRPALTLSLIVTFGSSSYANTYCCHVQPFLRGPLRRIPVFDG